MATFIVDMARLDPHIIRTHIDQITDLLTAEVIFKIDLSKRIGSIDFYS